MIIVLFVFTAVFLGVSTQTNTARGAVTSRQEPDPSIITPEIEKEINEYTAGTVSSVIFSDGAQETFPFQADPFTKYQLSLSKEGERGYTKGENLRVEGNLIFNSNAEPAIKDFLKDCDGAANGENRCLDSPAYSIPSLQNLGLFVQVFRKDEDKQGAIKGDFLVDEFYAFQGTNLKENEVKNFVVNWKVPQEVKDGNYYLAFFVNAGKAFDLWGTPLLPLSFAKTFEFSVKSDDSSAEGTGVELDKNNIEINGKSYSYRQPAPEIAADGNNEVTVEVPVTNLDPEEKSVILKYDLFRWSQTDPTNLLDSKKEARIVEAGEKTVAKFTFSPNNLDSVYTLKISANLGDSVSTADIRFVTVGKNRGIFRFLGIVRNQEGVHYPMFCLRDAAWKGLFQGKVKIAANDAKGKSLGIFEKEANIGVETRCFTIPQLKIAQGDCLAVKGEIFNKEGKIMDFKEASVPCEAKKGGGITNAVEEIAQTAPFKGKKGLILLFVVVAFAVGGIILYLNNKKKINGQ